MSPTKVLVLGIDAASPELLLKWSADGTLPNIGRLIGRGQSGPVSGLDGFFIGSTWPSIYTGLSPASHGFHYLVQLRPGTYEYYRPSDHGLFHGTPFWTTIGQNGGRVAILDAPLCPPEPSINGIQVCEWGGHDAVYGFKTEPADLADFIVDRFGDHPAGANCDGSRRTAGDYASFVDALVQGVSTKAEITRHLLGEGNWDLFMQVFSEAHCVGHQCWHLHDTSHPAYDSSITAVTGDPLQRVYTAIDNAVGEIIGAAGDCTVFVFSSHSMAHWYGAQFLLSQILYRLGVARPAHEQGRYSPSHSPITDTVRWAWHALPRSIRRILAGVRNRLRPKMSNASTSLPSIDVDPEESSCFGHRNGLAVGGIRLNLRGREPDGILDPGHEADQFSNELVNDLLEIVEYSSGLPLIKRVIRVSDYYQGPRLAELPDLLVEYNDAIPVGSSKVADGLNAKLCVWSKKIGILEGTNSYGRTGDHRPQGFAVAAGPGISPGSFSRSVSVLDLAPTWTRMLGIELEQAEGRPIETLSPLAGN